LLTPSHADSDAGGANAGAGAAADVHAQHQRLLLLPSQVQGALDGLGVPHLLLLLQLLGLGCSVHHHHQLLPLLLQLLLRVLQEDCLTLLTGARQTTGTAAAGAAVAYRQAAVH
jgi:hypothetical protein